VQDGHQNGIVVGVVVSLDDRTGQGRVKVRYPHLGNKRSHWARLVAPMAGPNRGTFFKPSCRDEVLIAFEHGDIRRPCVLGSMWSNKDLPPVRDKPKENNVRQIRSRSGHVITFDDTGGAERLVVQDSAGKRRVVIDSAGQRISVTADEGHVDVSATKGTITLDAKSVVIQGDTVSVKATQGLTLGGQPVNIN
jgi:uncharacterized protein involved in type VI secretion and phage assembly